MMPGRLPFTGLGKSVKGSRKIATAIDEITFNASAREEYLTGFHKRKLQRVQKAKEENIRKEREEKIKARKKLREDRKADLERHVQDVNLMVSNATKNETDNESEEPNAESPDRFKAAPKVNREEEYVDDDRYTTVTVEAVDVTKHGLCTVTGEDEDEQDSQGDTTSQIKNPISLNSEKGVRKGKRIWIKEWPRGVKKKKKFRYESKAERRITRYREKSGNKSKAKTRKE